MNYASTATMSKIVRKVLRKEFGTKNVSVTSDHGWIRINIEPEAVKDEDKGIIRTRVRKIALDALKAENIRIGTYISDDGYNTEHEQMLITIQ